MAYDQRRRVAYEAARLLYQREEKNRYRAKRRAAERLLGEAVQPRDLPTDREIRTQIEAVRQVSEGDSPLVSAKKLGQFPKDRSRLFETLLLPLESVRENRNLHPEGDALYHSLQVFALARDALPYDEEFLTAALLHDVGKAIDPRDHVAAALEALDGAITPRTAWLIEHHVLGLGLREGTLGVRLRHRLEASENFEELKLLADCDRRGRAVGVPVPDVPAALDYLRNLALENGD
ncbi:MAG: HD domain-containing protein [Pirellulales bacterium]|nr:HD domain-containing protein [Pirellulales bacterium]